MLQFNFHTDIWGTDNVCICAKYDIMHMNLGRIYLQHGKKQGYVYKAIFSQLFVYALSVFLGMVHDGMVS